MNRTTLYCPLYTATQWKPRVCDWKSKVCIFVSSIRSHFSRNDCSSPSRNFWLNRGSINDIIFNSLLCMWTTYWV
ncbi:hypothetical protein ACSBR2_036593 [Camellia fascicularis]